VHNWFWKSTQNEDGGLGLVVHFGLSTLAMVARSLWGLCKKKEFYILTLKKKLVKKTIEMKIVQNAHNIVYQWGNGLFCISKKGFLQWIQSSYIAPQPTPIFELIERVSPNHLKRHSTFLAWGRPLLGYTMLCYFMRHVFREIWQFGPCKKYLPILC